jgi:NAD(P)-dependent dehydrogenase (short-subunit alcohol dehydrogenase family)
MGDSVLITGAGSGMGLASALYLAERGFRVYASVPDMAQRADVEAAAAEHGVSLRVLQLDVTDESSIQSAVDTVVAEAGGIFGVVNSAGLGLRGFFEDLSEEEIRRVYDVNVFGVMAVTRAVLPPMRVAQRGRVVIITSAGGRVASMTISGYCSGKFALEGFGESLALEVAPFGLHVSMIEPGLVMTPHFTVHRGRAKGALDPNSPYYVWFLQHEQVVDNMLRSNRITPADVAQAVHRALTDRRPRLRYIVGWRAKLLIALHRYVPGEWFRRLYTRQLVRMVTQPKQSARKLNDLALPDTTPKDYLA